jgi:hypothetical protein
MQKINGPSGAIAKIGGVKVGRGQGGGYCNNGGREWSELRVLPAQKERSYAEHQYVLYLQEITAKSFYYSYVKKH